MAEIMLFLKKSYLLEIHAEIFMYEKFWGLNLPHLLKVIWKRRGEVGEARAKIRLALRWLALKLGHGYRLVHYTVLSTF